MNLAEMIETYVPATFISCAWLAILYLTVTLKWEMHASRFVDLLLERG